MDFKFEDISPNFVGFFQQLCIWLVVPKVTRDYRHRRRAHDRFRQSGGKGEKKWRN